MIFEWCLDKIESEIVYQASFNFNFYLTFLYEAFVTQGEIYLLFYFKININQHKIREARTPGEEGNKM